MCDAQTLTQSRRDELRKRIADGTAAIASDSKFVAKTTTLGTSISTLISSAGKCCPRGLAPADWPLLRTLLAGSDVQLDAFLTAYDKLFSAKEGLDHATKDAQDCPVQSMDDDHSESFLASFVPHLIDNCGKQVIVLSHVERITDRLRELNVGTPLRHYHLSQFLHSGPILVEQNRIAKTLSQIKTWSQGNNDNRESAMERLRELIELFIRELYLREKGVPISSEYDKANPRTLLGIFRTLTLTTVQENAGLDDSIGFTDPSHHTEVGYTTPVSTRIAPHINRVENLLRKYALLT